MERAWRGDGGAGRRDGRLTQAGRITRARGRRMPGWVVLAALLVASPPALGGIGSLIRGAAKLGKLASKAGKVGKAAKSAKAAKLAAGAGGAALVAERSGLIFKALPDEVGRVGVFVTGGGDDGLRVIQRTGTETMVAPETLGATVDELGAAGQVDLVVDLGTALRPGVVDDVGDARLFVADADGGLHSLRRGEDGRKLLVDAAEGAMDLGQFALENLTASGVPEDRGLVVVPVGLGHCWQDTSTVAREHLPDDLDEAGAVDWLGGREGEWVVAISGSQEGLSTATAMAAAQGHDLTGFVIQDLCDVNQVDTLVSAVIVEDAAGSDAPLADRGQLEIAAVDSTDPLVVYATWPEADGPHGVTAATWVVHWGDPEALMEDDPNEPPWWWYVLCFFLMGVGVVFYLRKQARAAG